MGRPLRRLTSLAEEKLVGTEELNAVQVATSNFHALLEANGRRLVDDVIAEAAALVMDRNDPLVKALESLREAPGVSP